ncbi:MAG: TolC family protein [Prevotella sp.]|nr:TolC family protein [Prevotella sp.]
MKSLQLSLLFILCSLSFSPAGAQSPWTLEQCIDYALNHNITIEQYRLRTEQQELQLQTAKASRLPDLNASVGENFSFGRGLTADNTYTNTNTSSTSFSVGTSVPIFTGFQIPNQIALNRLNLEAATQDLEKARNDIRMQVAQEYVQVLYNMEILDVARRQVSIDSAQVARLQALLDVGRTSQAELSQQLATMAQSRLTVTQADNNLQLALLSLSQLLELDTPAGFTIVRPALAGDSTIPSASGTSFANASTAGNGFAVANDIFSAALTSRPEIQADQLRLQAADRSIKVAEAGLYPTLSFSAGLGTNYYTTSGFHSDGFGTQLKNNFSQYLGLNLSIPIFNRFQTRNSIRAARLDRVNQLLQLDQTRKALYKEIQTAYYNTVAAGEKLRSSDEARRASQDAFQLVQAKYEQGKATITEFNEAKNAYLKAESDLTQARYEYLYQRALLRFYRGEPLSLDGV